MDNYRVDYERLYNDKTHRKINRCGEYYNEEAVIEEFCKIYLLKGKMVRITHHTASSETCEVVLLEDVCLRGDNSWIEITVNAGFPTSEEYIKYHLKPSSFGTSDGWFNVNFSIWSERGDKFGFCVNIEFAGTLTPPTKKTKYVGLGLNKRYQGSIEKINKSATIVKEYQKRRRVMKAW